MLFTQSSRIRRRAEIPPREPERRIFTPLSRHPIRRGYDDELRGDPRAKLPARARKTDFDMNRGPSIKVRADLYPACRYEFMRARKFTRFFALRCGRSALCRVRRNPTRSVRKSSRDAITWIEIWEGTLLLLRVYAPPIRARFRALL